MQPGDCHILIWITLHKALCLSSTSRSEALFLSVGIPSFRLSPTYSRKICHLSEYNGGQNKSVERDDNRSPMGSVTKQAITWLLRHSAPKVSTGRINRFAHIRAEGRLEFTRKAIAFRPDATTRAAIIPARHR
jgi:hypothetical protein